MVVDIQDPTSMEDEPTSPWPTLTRRTYDQVRRKTRARALSKPLPVALLLCVGFAINLHGQRLAPDPAVVGCQSSSSITGTVRDSRSVVLVGIEVRALGQNNNLEFKLAPNSDSD